VQRLRGLVTTMTGHRDKRDSAVKPRLTANPDRRVVENDEYASFLRRAIRAFGRRIAAGDIDALADVAFLSAQLDQTIKDSVTGLRERGYSWADIGRQLGVTKQAAQQRWGGDT
jgi:ribosomal protein S20